MRELVADKPTVGLVRVANNTAASQPISVHVVVKGSGGVVLRDQVISMGTLAAGEVRKQYLFTDDPILFPPGVRPYQAQASLTLVHGNTQESGQKCMISNDFSSWLTWSVITSNTPSHLWVRTGALLDATDYARPEELVAIRDIAIPFINGVYPVPTTTHDTLSWPLIPPLTSAQDFLYSILQVTGIPFDSLLPVALVFELNGVAVISGNDRVMGVLEPKWFSRFRYDLWADVTGFSLGTFAPRAVIFQSGDATAAAPTLPAHELGHTYGLSMDPSIKDPWACNWAPPLGVIACGLTGGYDEYRSEDHPAGIDTWGYWVPQGPSNAAMLAVAGEQCDSHCMMGPSPAAAQTSWAVNKKWIDAADYEQLLQRLATPSSQGAFMMATPARHVYLSGMIAENRAAYLGTSFVLPSLADTIDLSRHEAKDLFAIRFTGSAGELLGEVTLPLDWNLGEFKGQMPVTFFAGTAVLPSGTTRVELWNRQDAKLLASRIVTTVTPTVTAPTISVTNDGGRSRTLSIGWSASDKDSKTLTHSAMLRPLGANTWQPLAYQQANSRWSSSVELAAGTYELRVMSTDGFNLGFADSKFSVPAK